MGRRFCLHSWAPLLNLDIMAGTWHSWPSSLPAYSCTASLYLSPPPSNYVSGWKVHALAAKLLFLSMSGLQSPMGEKELAHPTAYFKGDLSFPPPALFSIALLLWIVIAILWSKECSIGQHGAAERLEQAPRGVHRISQCFPEQYFSEFSPCWQGLNLAWKLTWEILFKKGCSCVRRE